MKEVHLKRRHIAKATTWRIIASLTTAIIAWFLGVPPKVVGFLFFAELLTKFALHYVHERVWYRYIRYGVKNV